MSALQASEKQFTVADRDAAQRALNGILERWYHDDGITAEQYRADVAAARERLALIESSLYTQIEVA